MITNKIISFCYANTRLTKHYLQLNKKYHELIKEENAHSFPLQTAFETMETH